MDVIKTTFSSTTATQVFLGLATACLHVSDAQKDSGHCCWNFGVTSKAQDDFCGIGMECEANYCDQDHWCVKACLQDSDCIDISSIDGGKESTCEGGICTFIRRDFGCFGNGPAPSAWFLVVLVFLFAMIIAGIGSGIYCCRQSQKRYAARQKEYTGHNNNNNNASEISRMAGERGTSTTTTELVEQQHDGSIVRITTKTVIASDGTQTVTETREITSRKGDVRASGAAADAPTMVILDEKDHYSLPEARGTLVLQECP